MHKRKPSSSVFSSASAFTIVELLIVIVVIAILAAIAVVAYTGIQGRAEESVIKSDLTQASKKLGMDNAVDGSYPTDSGDPNSFLSPSSGTSFQYTSTSSSYCLSATRGTRAFHITQGGSPQAGVCGTHIGPGGGSGTEIAFNAPIQSVTATQCQALPVYTGSNETAVRTTTDSRGGTTRTYRIAKLADNKCWMLDNLKLGSTSSAITLTSADSDVGSNFTLPQVATSGALEYDLPRAYGPVPGDTGSGATNFGYLYNWSAATAGETRTSITTGNAPYSICPLNWRLPTGGPGGEFAALDIAFGGTGMYVWQGESNIALWQHDGPLKVTLAGNRISSFGGQGWFSGLWSARSDDWDGASSVHFGHTDVDPDSVYYRNAGYSVRCLLN